MQTESAQPPASALQDFYRGATVFLTGGTGFMGKVLLYKLLRSCPDLTRVFLLVREKKGRSAEERVQDIASLNCFSSLFQQRPELRFKLTAVAGDISVDALGISAPDRRLLREQVDVVFHLAATIRFDEELKAVINQNVRSTREMMILCKTFSHLKSVVYISTAFSHCPLSTIKECLYEPPIPSSDAIQMADRMDNDLLNTMTPGFLGQWPNTYSFSKAIAEDAVRQHGQGLPVGVFRPSIVVSSKEEPEPGWVDSMLGPVGMSLGIAAGVVRVMPMDVDVACNIVPCDMSINCLIAAAWDIAENQKTADIPVYNCVVPKENSHSWRDGYKYLSKNAKHLPISNTMWYVDATFSANWALINVLYALLHFLPALLIDIFTFVTAKQAKMVGMYRKIHKMQALYFYFNTRVWQWEVGNVQDMWRRLSDHDQQVFNFDFLALDWDDYYKDLWAGIRTYLVKDTDKSLPAARARLNRLYCLHRSTQAVILCLAAYLCWVVLVR